VPSQIGVRADLAGHELVLYGRQDALASWARHGARLVRLLSCLLACGLPAQSGEALVEAPDGRQWRFRLDGEVLGFLGLDCTGAAAATQGARQSARRGSAPARTTLRTTFASGDLLAAWRQQDALMAEFAALRRTGGSEGWALRRAAEPLIVAGAVIPALFVCTRGGVRVPLVLAPTNAAEDALLAELNARVPLVLLRLGKAGEETAASPAAPGVAATRSSTANRSGPSSMAPLTLTHAERGDLATLPGLLDTAAERAERRAGALRLETLLAEVRAAGVLSEAALAERLGCAEEEVAERLAKPILDGARAEQSIHYVEGFGLCTGAVLTRARAAAADVAGLRERADGAARVARVLGRRLREVTGASEGIECLIAYLGAA
jgi:hypothetical protein